MPPKQPRPEWAQHNILLRLYPRLHDETLVFVQVRRNAEAVGSIKFESGQPTISALPSTLDIRMAFFEPACMNLVTTERSAREHDLQYQSPSRMITLGLDPHRENAWIHENIAKKLTELRIPVTLKLGFEREYLFVPTGCADAALAACLGLADAARKALVDAKRAEGKKVAEAVKAKMAAKMADTEKLAEERRAARASVETWREMVGAFHWSEARSAVEASGRTWRQIVTELMNAKGVKLEEALQPREGDFGDHSGLGPTWKGGPDDSINWVELLNLASRFGDVGSGGFDPRSDQSVFGNGGRPDTPWPGGFEDSGPQPGGFDNGGPRPSGFMNTGPSPGGFGNTGPRPGGFDTGPPRPPAYTGPRPGGFDSGGPRPGGFDNGGPRQGGFVNGGPRPGGFDNGGPQPGVFVTAGPRGGWFVNVGPRPGRFDNGVTRPGGNAYNVYPPVSFDNGFTRPGGPQPGGARPGGFANGGPWPGGFDNGIPRHGGHVGHGSQGNLGNVPVNAGPRPGGFDNGIPRQGGQADHGSRDNVGNIPASAGPQQSGQHGSQGGFRNLSASGVPGLDGLMYNGAWRSLARNDPATRHSEP